MKSANICIGRPVLLTSLHGKQEVRALVTSLVWEDFRVFGCHCQHEEETKTCILKTLTHISRLLLCCPTTAGVWSLRVVVGARPTRSSYTPTLSLASTEMLGGEGHVCFMPLT